MADTREFAEASLAKAKTELIEAARGIDPLAPMRTNPFVSISIAAGIGAILGTNRERLAASGDLMRSISTVVGHIAHAAGKYEAASADRGAKTIQREPARPSAPN